MAVMLQRAGQSLWRRDRAKGSGQGDEQAQAQAPGQQRGRQFSQSWRWNWDCVGPCLLLTFGIAGLGSARIAVLQPLARTGLASAGDGNAGLHQLASHCGRALAAGRQPELDRAAARGVGSPAPRCSARPRRRRALQAFAWLSMATSSA